MTLIKIGLVKLYFSPILDMFNGEIIAYNISRTPNMEQVYDILDKAFARFDTLDGLVLHTPFRSRMAIPTLRLPQALESTSDSTNYVAQRQLS